MSDIIRLDQTVSQTPSEDRNPALVYCSTLAASGRRTTISKLNTIARLLGHRDIGSVPWHLMRYEHVAAIRTALIESGYAPATVNSALQALRGVARACWNLELITSDDYQRIRDVPPVRSERLPAGRAVTVGELTALMNACARDESAAGIRDAAAIALMYWGLRRSEIVELDLADHDPETDELLIRGKGRKERNIFLDNGARDALADWRLVRGDHPGPMFIAIRKDGEILRDQGRLSDQAIYNLLKKRAQQGGVRDLSCHDLRRSFVSDLLDTGQVDISTVARLCGHAQVTTTAQYDRRGDEAKKKAVSLLHIPYRRRDNLPLGEPEADPAA